MRDMLPPLFQIATGLGAIVFLAATLYVRRVNGPMWARLQLVGLLTVPAGFFIMSAAVAKSSLGQAGPMLITAGVIFFIGSVFVATGIVLAVRQKQ